MNLTPSTRENRPWRGPNIDWQSLGLHRLESAELAILDSALRQYQVGPNKDFQEMSKADFQLEALTPLFEKMNKAIYHGPGFVMLRGLDTQRYSRDELATLFYAIGLHIGTPIVQSHQGELLGHVINLTDVEKDPRGYHTGGHLGMHTDSCDIVALMCLKSATSGGESRIADAQAVMETIERERPDLAEVLQRGMYFRRMDADAEYGAGPVLSPNRIPIYSRKEGRFSCYFIGGYIERAAKAGDVVLDEKEKEALAMVNELASSPKYYLDMQFSDGDMQFLNNRRLLHGRTHYDEPKPMRERRHLIRMWLKMQEWPAMPPEQVFHSQEDRDAWGKRREPFMDLPSRYLAEREALLQRVEA